MNNRTMPVILAIVSGLIFAAAYPPAPPYIAWLAFIALAPLVIAIETVKTNRQAGWLAFLFSATSMSLVMSWLLAAYPLTWMGLEPSGSSFLAATGVWLLVSAVFASILPAAAVVYRRLRKGTASDIQLFAGLWVLSEYGRGLAVSLFVLGPESGIGNFWTFGALGYAASGLPYFLPLAKFTGLYGLSFALAAINAIAAQGFLKAYRTSKPSGWPTGLIRPFVIPAAIIAALGLAGLAIGRFYPAKAAAERKIALIQTNFPTHMTSTPADERLKIETELRLMADAETSTRPDIFVLPENSNLSAYFKDGLEGIFDLIFPDGRDPLVIDVSTGRRGAFNSETIFYLSPKSGLLAFSPKKFFIPWGEYLPYWTEGAARLAGFGEWVEKFNFFRRIAPLPAPPENLNADNHAIGTVACSGIAAPVFYRRLAGQKAQILVNSASQAIFQKSSLFFGQFEAMLRFHAAANNRQLLQAANGGFSYHIDQNGSLLERTDALGNTALIVQARLISTKTLYTGIGEWMLAFSLLTVGSMLRQKIRKQSTGSP